MTQPLLLDLQLARRIELAEAQAAVVCAESMCEVRHSANAAVEQIRNRGVQTALLHRRIQRATEMNCDLVVSLALPGSHSQRNIARLGFQAFYTRVKFDRALAFR